MSRGRTLGVTATPLVPVLVPVLALVLMLVLAAACSGGGESEVAEPTPNEPVVIEAVRITDDTSPHAVVVAAATVPDVEVFASPEAATATRTLQHPNEAGGPLVFVVNDAQADWLQVQLPIRPNGSTGWIRRADVELSTHRYRMEVHLQDFDLRVFHDGEMIFQSVVAVARNNAPTPGGSYYLTELLRPRRPNTIYGQFAYGLSGFSERFESFRGGPGQLGIHGTNDPETLGTPVSNGCIRLHNDDIGLLVDILPLGVPVDVFA